MISFRYFFIFFFLLHLGLFFSFPTYMLNSMQAAPNLNQHNSINISFTAKKQSDELQTEPMQENETVKEKEEIEEVLPTVYKKVEKTIEVEVFKPVPKPKTVNEEKKQPKKKQPTKKANKTKKQPKKQTSPQIDKDNKEKESTTKNIASLKSPNNNPESSLGEVHNTNFVKFYPPVYPPLALRRQLEGKVIIHVLISAQGYPLKAKIISSSNSIFDDSAIKSAMKSSYSPILQNLIPIKAWVKIPITFQLR